MKKRLFAIVLAVLIVLPFIASASAADTESTVAVTLKLEAVDGTAAVANKAGKKLTITKSMKLFNGYSVATAAESYAYLNLDSTKAVKMDASSKIELRESGKKLEALLKSGNLFFNVSKPLEEGESLNIRTSTMVAGIRGTSGWVNVIDSKTTEIHMLTGSVELTCTDPVTGEVTTETVSAGEVATLTVEEAAPVNINSDITIEIYTEEVVPGYVAQAIKSDAELQELITEETALSVPVIIGSADEKLAAEQTAAAEALEVIEEAVAAEQNTIREPVWEDTEVAETPAPESATPAPEPPAPASTPEPTPAPPPPTAVTLTGPLTDTEVTNALTAYTTVTLDSAAIVTISADVTIPIGKTLINQGTITSTGNFGIINLSNTSYYNEETAVIDAGVTLQNGDDDPGHMVLAGIINGTILQSNDDSTLEIPGTFNGTLTASGGTINGSLTAQNGAILNLSGGIINGDVTIADGGTLNLLGGTIYGSNTPNVAALTIQTGATAELVSGEIDGAAQPAINLLGTMQLQAAVEIFSVSNQAIIGEQIPQLISLYLNMGNSAGYETESIGGTDYQVSQIWGTSYEYMINNTTRGTEFLIIDTVAGNGQINITRDVTLNLAGGTIADAIAVDYDYTLGRDNIVSIIGTSGSVGTITNSGTLNINCEQLTTTGITNNPSGTINLTGGSITCANGNGGTGEAAISNNSGTLTITNTNITMTNASPKPAITLTGGAVTMASGTITGNINIAAGQTIASTFTMNGGTISLQPSGSNSDLLNNGTMYITGGTIRSSTAAAATITTRDKIYVSGDVTFSNIEFYGDAGNNNGQLIFAENLTLTWANIPQESFYPDYDTAPITVKDDLIGNTFYGTDDGTWTKEPFDYSFALPQPLRAAVLETTALYYGGAVSGAVPYGEGGWLVTDVYSKSVRLINPDGSSEVFAGRAGTPDVNGEPIGGYNDAIAAEAAFAEPWAIAPFLSGYLVTDAENNAVRYIADGIVETAVGSGKAGYADGSGMKTLFDRPTGLASDGSGVYIADTNNNAIRYLDTNGNVTTVVRRLNAPTGLYYADGALYIADTGSHTILKLEDGRLSTIAGTDFEKGSDEYYAGGYQDGAALSAKFSSPTGLTVTADGTIYVTDSGNGAIRKIQNGAVTTVSLSDANRGDAFPVSPRGIVQSGGNLYICDIFAGVLFELVTQPFEDVSPEAWYADAVDYVYSRGLMVGTSGSEFNPNATVTRAMFVTILSRMYTNGNPGAVISGALTFPDVPDGEYYTAAVSWAADKKLIVGYEGNFDPDGLLTRETLFLLLYNYVNTAGGGAGNIALTAKSALSLGDFSDRSSVSPWAKSAAEWIIGSGIVVGSNRQINPKQNITRAETARLLMLLGTAA